MSVISRTLRIIRHDFAALWPGSNVPLNLFAMLRIALYLGAMTFLLRILDEARIMRLPSLRGESVPALPPEDRPTQPDSKSPVENENREALPKGLVPIDRSTVSEPRRI